MQAALDFGGIEGKFFPKPGVSARPSPTMGVAVVCVLGWLWPGPFGCDRPNPRSELVPEAARKVGKGVKAKITHRDAGNC